MKIWTNGDFGPEGMALLRTGTAGHTLVLAKALNQSVLAAAGPDPDFAGADIAFGQPHVADCLTTGTLKWIEVSSAGYTRYDTEEFKTALRERGTIFTNGSEIYADSCAEHVLAMMLALGRQLLPSYDRQRGDHSWPYGEVRGRSTILRGQTVTLLGFGAIGRRLAELLAPFQVKIYALRRQRRSEAGVHVVGEEQLTRVLGESDHVVNLLPENEATRNYVNARRLACCQAGARFYNIGRGATVDQPALMEALQAQRLGAAYLDVMTPEPLPPGDPLWSTPNCYLTPHTAGGRRGLEVAIVSHFLENLAKFESGGALTDRVF